MAKLTSININDIKNAYDSIVKPMSTPQLSDSTSHSSKTSVDYNNIDWNKIYRDELYSNTISSTTTIVDTTKDRLNEITERLKQIETQLLILNRNKHMEKKYPELAEAYHNYMHILKMLTALDILKDEDQ